MRKALSGLILIAIVAGLGLLLVHRAPPPAQGSILRAKINADIVSSDPGMKRDGNTDAVLMHVVEGLVEARENGTIAPMLASGWTVSPDGRTYHFALRHDVTFHNGAPLTASDVKWSLDRYFAADSHWRCKSDFGKDGIATVSAVRVVDLHTIDVALDRPAPMFLPTLARIDCGGTGIAHRASIGADGKWQAPIGTGPFRWGEWRHNQYIELRRFADYRALPGGPDGNAGGKKALVDRLRFSVIPDSSSAAAALLRGSLDVLDNMAPNEIGGLQGAPGVRIESALTADIFCILLRSDAPVLRDARLRRALALSLDTVALTRAATRGWGQPSNSPIPAASPYYRAQERQPIRRDLATARALVKASGYHGEPIELITSHTPPDMYDVAIVAQAMAREAGINIQVVVLDWASQLARYSAGNYQATVFQFSPRLDPSMMLGLFIGDHATDKRKVWTTPEAIGLLRQSMATEGPARQAVIDTLDRRFREEAPAIILYSTRRLTALRTDVSGYHSWQASTQRLWNVGIGGVR
jgi:peptide/nickel transport system substrate-binding protein